MLGCGKMILASMTFWLRLKLTAASLKMKIRPDERLCPRYRPRQPVPTSAPTGYRTRVGTSFFSSSGHYHHRGRTSARTTESDTQSLFESGSYGGIRAVTRSPGFFHDYPHPRL